MANNNSNRYRSYYSAVRFKSREIFHEMMLTSTGISDLADLQFAGHSKSRLYVVNILNSIANIRQQTQTRTNPGNPPCSRCVPDLRPGVNQVSGSARSRWTTFSTFAHCCVKFLWFHVTREKTEIIKSAASITRPVDRWPIYARIASAYIPGVPDISCTSNEHFYSFFVDSLFPQ